MSIFDIFKHRDESIDDLMIDPEELVKISDDQVLDTTSASSTIKFKHNLELLLKKIKEQKKIDKFVTIRDDNIFPDGYEWRVASSIELEENTLPLSFEIRRQLAIEKAGIKTNINGISIPINEQQIMSEMEKIDKSIGNVMLPVKYRSTKHFTINTPLEVTGDYNTVSTDRTYTIIDSIEPFIKSGYAYSLAYHDAYLDVSHESLKITKDAIILIEKSKYDNIKNNKEIMEQLSKRKVVVYTGDEYLAIDMVLSEMGVLPSKVGQKYATYDNETNEILEQSIRQLASDNNIKYDRSHGGSDGHFTSKIDDMNNEYGNYLEQFAEFLRRKFKENAEFITTASINNQTLSQRLVQLIGADRLSSAINEYNILAKKQAKLEKDEYINERKNITPEISDIFKATIKTIDAYCENNQIVDTALQDKIQYFMHAKKVEEQLKASSDIIKQIGYQNVENNNIHK